MLTLVDGTTVTQCKLHTMEVDPIDPISMEVRFDNTVAPTRAIPLACVSLVGAAHTQASHWALPAGDSAGPDRGQVRRTLRRHRRARMGWGRG